MSRKKLLTYHDAKPRKTQHKLPCSDCPFSRNSLPGWLGNESPEWWMQLAHGEGTSECHTSDKMCAGLAIYRANVCKSVRDKNALALPPNRKKVFATPMEFLSHHKREGSHGEEETETG